MAISLATSGLSKAFGTHPLFEGITCSVDSGDRSTLLSILAGEILPDEGTRATQRGLGSVEGIRRQGAVDEAAGPR